MAITIKKIAEICNTSRGTVDRVINKRGGVNEELEAKILAVIAEYNYRPNTTARALVNSKKRYTIGAIVNSVGNHFFDDVIAGIEAAAKKVNKSYGINVVVKQIKGYCEVDLLATIEELEKEEISALAMTPVYSQKIIDKIKELKERGIPTVLINSDIDESERLASVSSNNYQSGMLAANLANLILTQASKVAVVTGSFSNKGHIKRVNGFKDVLSKGNKKLEIVQIQQNDDDDKKSYEVTQKILENQDIDLIYFCAAGIQGGIEAIVASGKNVHAITVDESETVKRYIDNGLIYATITQQPFEQGYKPISLLAKYLVLNRMPEKTKIHTVNQIKIKQSAW